MLLVQMTSSFITSKIWPLRLQYLRHLFDLSINRCNVPAISKHVIITPVPRPNKPADLGTSYRPISVLCPAVEVLEHLLQPQLNYLALSPNQHGFRPNHSTISALLPLVHKIAQGLINPVPPSTKWPRQLIHQDTQTHPCTHPLIFEQ